MKFIGRYIIRGLLGRGGMGSVYMVELPVIGKIAALKLLDPDPMLEKLLGLRQLQDQFIAEAKTLAHLRHPNIVEIHDFDQWQDRPFYVMDFHAHTLGAMMGESYRIESESRIIPPERAIAYGRQMLEGLACLHEAGIIHRDIKPYNMLITAYDTLKICDFGLSKLRGERFAGPSNLNVGSPYYAAPEQEKNPDVIDQRADIYPVGITLYRMLTGRLPESAPNTRKYRLPSSRNHDLDGEWDKLIARATAPSPAQRFPGAKEMLQALMRLQSHWQALKAQTCSLPPVEADVRPASKAIPPLRTAPRKMPPGEIKRQLRLDPLWRPSQYVKNDFYLDNETILDRETRLIWQAGGCGHPCTWYETDAYITRLNQNGFGGQNAWRLPTMEELVTLLRPVPRAHDWCMPPLFDTVQRHLWSADRRSFVAAYYVDAELGFVGWQDFSAPHFVRAVCSAQDT